MGLVTVALGGKGGGDMVGLADHLLIVPSDTTARIQEMHITLGQMLCGALEIELGLAPPADRRPCRPEARCFAGFLLFISYVKFDVPHTEMLLDLAATKLFLVGREKTNNGRNDPARARHKGPSATSAHRR